MRWASADETGRSVQWDQDGDPGLQKDDDWKGSSDFRDTSAAPSMKVSRRNVFGQTKAE
jgi:hypothetical protein